MNKKNIGIKISLKKHFCSFLKQLLFKLSFAKLNQNIMKNYIDNMYEVYEKSGNCFICYDDYSLLFDLSIKPSKADHRGNITVVYFI